MRLRSIRLGWFRGAADAITLHLNGRPTVVYGINGAGKSSFVDGVEAALSGGKLRHLSHEYSGRHQEKGIINTARPAQFSTTVNLTLMDGSESGLKWVSAGAARTQSGGSTVQGWDFRRTALRQEELSGFIQATKGDKYNAILPLLGLSDLETAADNLHRLVKSMERLADLPTLRSRIDAALERRREAFPGQTAEQIVERVEQLRATYAPGIPVEPRTKVVEGVLAAIEAQVSSLDADNRRAVAIGEIATSDLSIRIDKVTQAGAKIAELTEPLIKERLNVLSAAGAWVALQPPSGGLVSCPACGQDVDGDEFRDHVTAERDRLSSVEALYVSYTRATGEVCDEAVRLRNVLKKADLQSWRAGIPPHLQDGFTHLEGIAFQDLRNTCGADDMSAFHAKLMPLIERAIQDSKQLPPQTQTLVTDKAQASAVQGSMKSTSDKAKLIRAEALISLTKALEKGVRDEIAERAKQVFSSISEDIRTYWQVLQPSALISDVRLLVPEDSNKAVEVALRFYGKDQDSPRLTLSEGQRNALGLCIFLAMANRASDSDQPVILDDVIISFDREHRSRVANLINQHFADRHLVVLTHDREWFFELQRLLPAGKWQFYRLLPYTSPSDGIIFSDHGTDFSAAKARAKTDPEEALGNVRRIMDVALSELAERIGLAVPHLRGGDNDHRTSGQFLVALERTAPKAFRKKVASEYVSNSEAIDAIKKAKPELTIWGNRGTHTFSGSVGEAEELIAGCEALLGHFSCGSCGTHVGIFPASGGKLECRCGNLQWRPV